MLAVNHLIGFGSGQGLPGESFTFDSVIPDGWVFGYSGDGSDYGISAGILYGNSSDTEEATSEVSYTYTLRAGHGGGRVVFDASFDGSPSGLLSGLPGGWSYQVEKTFAASDSVLVFAVSGGAYAAVYLDNVTITYY
jgi:hypothetical protein